MSLVHLLFVPYLSSGTHLCPHGILVRTGSQYPLLVVIGDLMGHGENAKPRATVFHVALQRSLPAQRLIQKQNINAISLILQAFNGIGDISISSRKLKNINQQTSPTKIKKSHINIEQ
jgi:hypothetical protein